MADGWETVPAQEWETLPARLNPNLVAQGARAEAIRAGGRETAERLSQRDPGIDYASGVPSAMLRARFSRMRNEAEQSQFLTKELGEGGWAKDSYGAYVITPPGLAKLGIKSDVPRALDEQTASRYDFADVAGSLPSILGGVGMGMAASGVGVVPGMALAGLGAAGGLAVDEIIKNLQGQQIASGGQVAGELAKEGGLSAAGEGAARGLMAGGRFLLGPAASRMTPAKKELADAAREQGFKIRPGSVTDAPILARWEGMVRSIFGDFHEAQNKKAAEAGIEKLTMAAGPSVNKEVAGEAVVSAIKKQRVAFDRVMGGRYQEIDDLVGGIPIVPTAAFKEQAEGILSLMPSTTAGKVVGGKDSILRDVLNMPERITTQTAQRLRSMFREAAEDPTILPDIAKHDARQMKRAVDTAFEQAKGADQTGIAKEAIEKLRAADAAYGTGIRQFDKPVVRNITKDASRASVDADMVLDYLIKPERVVRLRQVKALVPDSEWSKVKTAHAQDLMSTIIQGTDDPLKSVFNGRAFRDSLNKYGRDVLEEVHGKQWVDDAYKFTNALMLAEKQTTLSGGIVAANVALHPIQNLPKLIWVRAIAQLVEQPGTFKYLTEGIKFGPATKEGAAALTRLATQAQAIAKDRTGSANVTLTPPEQPQ